MTRFIFWMLVLYIAWRWWRRVQVERRRRDEQAPPRQAERVLACQNCRVYLPEGEGLSIAGRFFCSDKCCRQAGLTPPGAER